MRVIKTKVPKKRYQKKTHAEKAAIIRRYSSLPFRAKKNFTKSEKSKITREYKKIAPLSTLKFVKLPGDELKKFKDRGYTTTDKGVFIDVPRRNDARRTRLENVRVETRKNGTVVESAIHGEHRRRDYIIGLSSKQKKEFVKDPKKFIRELRETTNIKRVKKSRARYIRLQWGAYSGTVDMAPDQLENYFSTDHGKKLLGKLTGIRIVTYEKIEKSKPRKKGKKTG